MTAAIGFTRRVFLHAALYLRGDSAVYGLAYGLVVVLSLLVDTQLPAAMGPIANVAIGGLTGYLQLLITFRMLHANGAHPPGYTPAAKTEARLPTVIVAGLFETVAVLLGLVVFVIPGILLMLLWSLAIPAIAAERLGANAALARSWRLARPALGALAMVGGVFVLAALPLVVAMVAAITLAPQAAWLQLVMVDAILPALILGSAAVWTAAYLELRDRVPTA
jgi:hypothetical protein